MPGATLFLTDIQPVLGSVDPTPTGYVFSVEQMFLPDGEMPRDNVATLELKDGTRQRVHLENVNVARAEDQGDLYRGRIILRAQDAPQP